MRLRRNPVAALVAPVLLAGGLVACSGDDGDDAAEEAVVRPSEAQTVTLDGISITVEPGPESVVSAVVTVEADHPLQPELTATAGDHRVEVPAPGRARATQVLALVGMRATTTYTLDLEGDPAFEELDDLDDLTFRTGSLPPDLPDVVTRVDGEPTPGFTLFNATPSDLSIEHPGNLIAVDDEGEVVWYHQDSQLISDARQLANGDLLFNFGNIGARRIDVLGQVVTDWTTETRVQVGQEDRFGHETFVDDPVVLATPRLHHEVASPLPNGNYLSLSQEIRTFRGFDDPGCPPGPFADPTVRPQRADVVIEYTPEGEIVHEVSLLDGIDPREQPGSQQCNLKTDEIGTLGNDVFVDWSHANSAEVFEDQNLVLVSSRNLSSVMALRWEADDEGPAGEVIWQLGPGLDIELTQGEWFFRQHAPEVQPDGTILIYDNGSQRPLDEGGADQPFSRAVQYELDLSGPPSTWTARQVWEHRIDTPGGPVYADFLGDADAIGEDHVLITHGAVVDEAVDRNTALIVEVARAEDPADDEIVLSIRVPPTDLIGWQTYRSEHLDTWYPQAIDRGPADDPPLPEPS